MSSHGRHQPSRESDTRKSSSSTSSLKSHQRGRRLSTSTSNDSSSSSAAEHSRSRKRRASKERRSSSTTATSKKRKRRRHSSSSSDDSEAKHSKKCKAKKKKKKRKSKKDKKSKSVETNQPTKLINVDKVATTLITPVSDDEMIGPAVDVMNTKSMKPMSKEEWDKQQSVIRKVYDPETGRHRLIRGEGEVLEEIVSHNQHKDINKKATDADGAHFQHMLGIKNPV